MSYGEKNCDGHSDQGRFGLMPCSRRWTVERFDKKYCWQHDPDRVEKERKKRHLKYEADQVEWDAKMERGRKRDEHRNLCVSAVEASAKQVGISAEECARYLRDGHFTLEYIDFPDAKEGVGG